jgi:hypothetical protein
MKRMTPDQFRQFLTDPLTTLALRPFALLATPGSPRPTTHPPSTHALHPDWNVARAEDSSSEHFGQFWWVADYDQAMRAWYERGFPGVSPDVLR